MTFTHPIDLDQVRAAAARIEGVAHRTPVVTSRTLDDLTGASVVLKPENLQRVGAFKFRGAYTAISALDPADRARGVAAFSSGNHAQAVALAAALHQTSATIVMPSDAPAAKLEATRGYGATVVEFDRARDDREAIAREIAERQGLALIPPYDHPAVMAGQGTAALELIEDAGPLDVLVVPVGGGGLIAGCATAAHALCPGVRVIGIEPESSDDTRRSLAAGERVRIGLPQTIADGLMAQAPGVLTFEIIQRLVEQVVLVSDGEIAAAMRWMFERLKLVAEPSGATGVAALLSGKIDVPGQRVGVIISGGNVSADRFATITANA